MFVLTAYEFYCLLCDGGTAVCCGTAVSERRKERAADTLDIDTGMFTETLILDGDDRIIKISVLDRTIGYVDPVDVLGTGKFCYLVILAVINERSL